MNNKTTVLALLAGIGAGAALGYWFASEKNDKLRKQISKALNEVSDDIKESIINEFDELRSKADEMKGKGISLKDSIMHALTDMKDEGKQKVLDAIDRTQRESNKIHENGKHAVNQL